MHNFFCFQKVKTLIPPTGYFINFDLQSWYDLRDQHSMGVFRNVNEYWTAADVSSFPSINWEYTTKDNVYWSELLNPNYRYMDNEGLSLYKGGKTFIHMFCRPTNNSMMNSQFGINGQYFNAISRWAIWYRLMRLTNSTTATDFKSSLNEFIAFDSTLPGWQSNVTGSTLGSTPNYIELPTMPLGKPEMIIGEWINGRFVEVK